MTPFIFFAHLASSDYTSVSPALIFSSNSPTVQAVQVPIVNDSILELSEVFTASLSLGNSNDHVKLMPGHSASSCASVHSSVLSFDNGYCDSDMPCNQEREKKETVTRTCL